MKAIKSLGELSQLAQTDAKYKKLAITAARNLGGSGRDLDDAMRWLRLNAAETDEDGVVGEVNFCRNLVK